MGDSRFDGLIFDMDGTLWDAVDSYCRVWDETVTCSGLSRSPVTRAELAGLMGQSIERIIAALLPGLHEYDHFLDRLETNEGAMMPTLGGRLYPGVRETVPVLAERCRLFMVSNCSQYGLPNFLKFTGLSPYFTDMLSYGQTHRGKADNICRLVNKHGLRRPLYVGDTQGDADACHEAGVPVAWAAYGFGHIDSPDYVLERFDDLLDKVSDYE